MASFRVVIAAITIVAHLPRLLFLIGTYVASEFHTPLVAGLPGPRGWGFWSPFFLLQAAAAVALLLGRAPRSSAAVLALGGAFLVVLEEQFFSHNMLFHLSLLAILAFSPPTLSLRRLLSAERKKPTYPAWPRRLICIQVAILFFYAALDKAFSPFWGADGLLLADLPHYFDVGRPGWPWAALQSGAFELMGAAPGAFSIATIAGELLLAAGFLCALRRLTVTLALGFAALLEAVLSPGVFPWDLAAATLLLLPAASARTAIAGPRRFVEAGRRRRLLTALDWLDRLEWSEANRGRAEPPDLRVKTARGRTLEGLLAWRHLASLLFAPILAILALARFGGARLGGLELGIGLVLWPLSLYALLWLPGVSPLLERAVRRPLARWLSRHPTADR